MGEVSLTQQGHSLDLWALNSINSKERVFFGVNFIQIFSLLLFSQSNANWTAQYYTVQRSSVWKSLRIQKGVSPVQWNLEENCRCSKQMYHIAIRDHINVLVNKYKKKIRAEERASGISPDEPSELDGLIQQITALEESSPIDTCSKDKADKGKAEDARMKAMERLFQGKKRASEGAEEGENRPKRTRRKTGDAMEFQKERVLRFAEIREKELELGKGRQEQQLQTQQLTFFD